MKPKVFLAKVEDDAPTGLQVESIRKAVEATGFVKRLKKLDKCQNCGKCRKWCPTDAIDEREGVSYIRQDDCIGCGECLAVCRFGAVRFNYSVESAILQKSMAEHRAGVLRHFGDKAVHVTMLTDITRDCDCLNRDQKKVVPDIGIIASSDIVALEQATLDITAHAYGQNIAQRFRPELDPTIQIEHAEKMGLGT